MHRFKVGDKFGDWTVIDEKTTLAREGGRQYLCECACGRTKSYVRATTLYKGVSTMCLKCAGAGSFIGIGSLSGSYFCSIRKGAEKRKLEFTVTLEYLHDLYIKQDHKCALSGVDIRLHRSYTQKGLRSKQTASLDRIDSSKGYIVGNVQWVHKDVNYMKQAYDQDYFVELCKKIAENDNNERWSGVLNKNSEIPIF